MSLCKWLSFAAYGAALSVLTPPAAAQTATHRPVLMISIDGMHPGDVIQAGKYGMKIPVLRQFVERGAWAEGVVNVTPTVTYPNHTTLVTGVGPAEHGIYTNTVFDPLGKVPGAWNWYAAEVRAPTLWQAVKAAGLVTASVMWPVTVHARAIDYNVPEFWRNKQEFDHYLLEAVSTPSGFLEEMEQSIGLFYGDGDLAMDEKVTRTAIRMIEKARPALLTIHIVSLDHVQHLTGPISAEAQRDLEQIDALVGRLMEAERKAYPEADIVVVSDHGFFPVNHLLHLNVALAKAGLITVTSGAQPRVASWKAIAWASGGSASIVLKDPGDRAVAEQAARVLDGLARNADNGIAAVLRGDEARANGALPGAAFVVDCRSGYAIGSAVSGPLVEHGPSTKGTHGYLSSHPEMNSSFFILGPGVKPGRNLGRVDIRRIAPTLARELGVSLPSAKMEPLPIR